jgi:sulfur carrier protein
MRVVLNGEPRELEAGATVREVVESLELPGAGRGVAVAVDSEVVPRGEWGERELAHGAKVEVLRAIQGG